MGKTQQRGAEDARAQLPRLLADAEQGRTTIITRHGRSIAALVPARGDPAFRQSPLIPLLGSGKGMWGRDVAAVVRGLREEWSR